MSRVGEEKPVEKYLNKGPICKTIRNWDVVGVGSVITFIRKITPATKSSRAGGSQRPGPGMFIFFLDEIGASREGKLIIPTTVLSPGDPPW